MPTYELAGRKFSSKEAVAQHARSIKDKYKPGTYLEGDELAFMYALLTWHPDAAIKIGAGVKAILIRANPMYGQNEFYLLRVDGSATEFSYKQCVQPSTPAADFRAACRVAIMPDIVAFSERWFAQNAVNPRCALTGERLTKAKAHVDHEPPTTFQNLLGEFVRLHDIDMGNVKLLGKTADNTFRLRIADPDLEKAWIEFHRKYAKLRVISEQANLSIVGKDWGAILEYLCEVDHADVLVSWKGTLRYFTHMPGLKRGIFVNADQAPDGAAHLDGTVALIELSILREKKNEASR